MRAVLSARSTKVPSWLKKYVSSRRIVPSSAPRKSAVRALDPVEQLGQLAGGDARRVDRFEFEPGEFSASHMSRVSAVRTARALVRAARRHETHEGLSSSKSMIVDRRRASWRLVLGEIASLRSRRWSSVERHSSRWPSPCAASSEMR